MEDDMENYKHKEDWFISELLKDHRVFHRAPNGFTNRFMQSVYPAKELSPELKKPLLDLKGKVIAIGIFLLLFIIGLSVGQEITGNSKMTAVLGNINNMFQFDHAILVTILFISFAMLLIFNEFLKKIFIQK
jgi:polyferredoxin